MAPRLHGLSPMTLRTAALSLALIAGSAVFLYRFAAMSVRSLGFEFPLDFGEGAVLDVSVRLARGENIYRPVSDTPPWLVANYPPVYYLVRALPAWAGEIAFWPGRLLSQLAALATAVLIALIARQGLRADRLVSAVAALTFLCNPFVVAWAQYDRVDLLALLLNWGGLWLLVRTPDSRSLAVACFVLSSFTRQTGAVAGVAAGSLFLLERRGSGAAITFAASVAGAGALILFALQAGTGGAIFHLVTGTVGELSLEQLVNLGGQVIDLMPLLLLITAGTVITAVLRRPAGWSLVAGYSAAAVILALTAAKKGSYINYFLDLCAAASLCLAAALTWARRTPAVVVVLALAVTLEIGMMARDNPLYSHLDARLNGEPAYRRLAALVAASPGPLLADEALGLLVTSRFSPDFHPFAMTQVARAGLWDEGPFVRRLEEQHYRWVLLRIPMRNPVPSPDMWTEAMLAAMAARYEEAGRFAVSDRAWIVVFRPRQVTVPSRDVK